MLLKRPLLVGKSCGVVDVSLASGERRQEVTTFSEKSGSSLARLMEISRLHSLLILKTCYCRRKSSSNACMLKIILAPWRSDGAEMPVDRSVFYFDFTICHELVRDELR